LLYYPEQEVLFHTDQELVVRVDQLPVFSLLPIKTNKERFNHL
jgi:hypothetical protein